MIKIERRQTAKAQKAIESLLKAKETDAGYNVPEVNAALKEIFYGKCYICENKEVTSYQIEHLIPHRGNPELKYAWDNLFLACAHCNNTKLGKFDPILDCTKEDVERAIAFRKQGYFGTDEKLLFEPLDSREETLEYKEAEDEEKEDLKYLLKRELGDASPFAAFKRWLIRDNKEAYPELQQYFDSPKSV